jgi:hypothetical protein
LTPADDNFVLPYAFGLTAATQLPFIRSWWRLMTSSTTFFESVDFAG